LLPSVLTIAFCSLWSVWATSSEQVPMLKYSHKELLPLTCSLSGVQVLLPMGDIAAQRLLTGSDYLGAVLWGFKSLSTSHK